MIVNISLATGNKLNCFISTKEMLSNILHSPIVLFCCFSFVCVAFYMLINYLLKKKQKKNS